MNEKFNTLMQKVCQFAQDIDLNTTGLVRDRYDEKTCNRWVISTSWKHLLDNSYILWDQKDEYSPTFNPLIRFPFVSGKKEEIESYKKRAEEKGAEWFSKQSIAFDGFVAPSPEFLAMTEIEQVEYALHESFHRTKKRWGNVERDHLSPEWEEARALVTGYIGATAFFGGSENESHARAHMEKHLDLARKVNQYYKQLDSVCGFRIGKDCRPVPKEQILAEREEVLGRARKDLGSQLGTPVNNAFFIYWHHFDERFPQTYDKVKDLDVTEAVGKLLHLD